MATPDYTLDSTTKPRAGLRKLVSRARLHGRTVESGPAGPVLAGPVFGMAHAQKSNNVRKTTIIHVPVNAYWPPAAQLLKFAAMLSYQQLTRSYYQHVMQSFNRGSMWTYVEVESDHAPRRTSVQYDHKAELAHAQIVQRPRGSG